jgi:hypothetical protein
VLSKAQIEEKLFGWNEEIDNASSLDPPLAPQDCAKRRGTVRGVGYAIGRAEELI